jgi:hypothetical protein
MKILLEKEDIIELIRDKFGEHLKDDDIVFKQEAPLLITVSNVQHNKSPQVLIDTVPPAYQPLPQPHSGDIIVDEDISQREKEARYSLAQLMSASTNLSTNKITPLPSVRGREDDF